MGKGTGDTVTHSETHGTRPGEAQAVAEWLVIKEGRPSGARKTLKSEQGLCRKAAFLPPWARGGGLDLRDKENVSSSPPRIRIPSRAKMRLRVLSQPPGGKGKTLWESSEVLRLARWRDETATGGEPRPPPAFSLRAGEGREGGRE